MPAQPADSIQVDCLDGSDPAWDRFVEARPDATFFHLSGWKTVIEESLGHRCHYLMARRGGEIVGVLPLTHVQGRIFGNSLIRSEEHTSELQSLMRISYAVFCLKKKTKHLTT